MVPEQIDISFLKYIKRNKIKIKTEVLKDYKPLTIGSTYYKKGGDVVTEKIDVGKINKIRELQRGRNIKTRMRDETQAKKKIFA